MMTPDAVIATPRPVPGSRVMIVLEPLSHPELGPIHIHETLFAIGRTEAPFDAYPPEVAADLSRRHARIFCEHGAVYLAELGSKNGTTVNGASVRQAITTLKSGDVLGLGKTLKYRVQLEYAAVQAPSARLVSLTLTPEDAGADLQPIVVTEFPFMISKADGTFARYKETNPAQLNYLSRRHAHLFVRSGALHIEDLGSTNGTFLNGVRLGEHAEALHEGDVLAFGGNHFVYRLGMQWDASARDPTLTCIGVASAPAGADADKTTFVAAADSFLNIFCVDPAPVEDEPPDPAAAPAPGEETGRPRGRAGVMAAGLYAAFGRKGAAGTRGLRRWALAVFALVVVLASTLYHMNAPEREADALLAGGQYAQAAAVANDALADEPDNRRLRAVGTEALLKANLPAWIAAVNAGRFQAAAERGAAMRQHARNNPDLGPLLDELDWIVALKTFVAARGGAQAPVRDGADGVKVQQFLRQWEDRNEAHQRAFMTMSSYVPAYRDAYAGALSDARGLALARGQP
jgi:pSer/pThr/pTyr-binding forkhead associated (FHA) protein